MPNIQSPRGTRDILPADQPIWQQVRATAEFIAEQMGFKPITVPTYEHLELFKRGIGEGTDVIDKELFLVRSQHTEPGQEEYALRPEGTAGIVRAYIEHGGHTWPQPVKLYSIVNNFRYDRPQKGRYREHTQISLEYLGDSSPFADAWVIYCTHRYLQELGLQNTLLQINTLGTSEERTSYVHALKEALQPHRDTLSPDSQKRLETNPLRILDSKESNDRAALEEIAKLRDFLGEASLNHYRAVLSYLEAWHIPYVENHFLVRGLDYYSHTAFEWVLSGSEGQQNSLGGGGRYDDLITKLGGSATSAVGAGLGLDRVAEAIAALGEETPPLSPDIFVVAADKAGLEKAPEIMTTLLNEAWFIDAAFSKDSVNSQLKAASRSGASAALIIGAQEIEQGLVQLKLLATGEQYEISLGELSQRIGNLLDDSRADHPGAQ